MKDFSKLQLSLASDLGEIDGMLTSDMSLDHARRLWLSRAFWKKFQDDLSPDCNSKASELFIQSNERCRNFSLVPKDLFEEELIGEVKSLLDSCFFRGPVQLYTLADLLEGCGTGPGASIDVHPSNFFTKLFDSTLSGTSEVLYRMYRYAISSCPIWLSAEEARQNKFGHNIVAGNRLSYVPKTSEISRTICTEPVLNMFFQKGIGSVFEEVLRKRFRIDISKQPIFNREMARTGSIDGSFGTIDLSSASDSIALSLLKNILPSYVYNWLEFSRSPVVTFPSGASDRLYMVSSMGNGFTFPLETIIFSSIVVACYRVLGIKPLYAAEKPLNFGVFGDDIIVRKDSYSFVVRALKLFGFAVNEEKSFNSGNFRESCGGDYFKGHDIRGVYCKSLKHDADVYSIVNRLIRWSARHGILLPETIRLLLGSVKLLPIPFADGDAEGIKVPAIPPGSKKDKSTGAVCYKALVQESLSFRVEYLQTKVKKYSIEEVKTLPPIDRTLDLSIPTDDRTYKYPRVSKRKRRDVFYNTEGLLVSFVGGFIRNGRITIRREMDSSRFKVRRRKTSSWGISAHTAYAAGFSRGDDWEIISALYLL